MPDRDITDVDTGTTAERTASGDTTRAVAREDQISPEQRELFDRKMAVAKAVIAKVGEDANNEQVYATGSVDGQDYVVLRGEDGLPGEAFYVNGGRTKKAELADIFPPTQTEGA